MANPEPKLAFDEQFDKLRAAYGDQIPLETVVDVLKSLLESLRGDLSLQHIKVYGELEALADFIVKAKEEIDTIRPDDIADKHIPTAHVELGAVGEHLEQATGTILDAAEVIERIADTTEGTSQVELQDAVTAIYEACNFQDITGQRMTKVISTLQAIENRIDRLVRVLGEELPERPRAQRAADTPEDDDAKLLNGPQVPANANSQADIDALLASFD